MGEEIKLNFDEEDDYTKMMKSIIEMTKNINQNFSMFGTITCYVCGKPIQIFNIKNNYISFYDTKLGNVNVCYDCSVKIISNYLLRLRRKNKKE